MNEDILVIIPVHNEEKTIGNILRELKKILKIYLLLMMVQAINQKKLL